MVKEMDKKMVAKGFGIVFITLLLFIAFGVFTYHYGSWTSDSPDLPYPESPMLYSPIKVIILDTPILIKALGLEPNESYAVQFSRSSTFAHNWTAFGTEYCFVIKFKSTHRIGDYVFLYLYSANQIIDALFFQVEEVNG